MRVLGAGVSSEYGGCWCFYQFWEAKSCKEVGFIRHVCFRRSFENSLSESSFLLQVFLSFCSKACHKVSLSLASQDRTRV